MNFQDTYGFIKCPSKEGSLIYFKHAELLDPTIVLKLNDEVEFTFITDAQLKKCQAIRISILPNGTLFNNILSKQRQPNNNNYNNNSTHNHNFQNNNNHLQQQQHSPETLNEVFNLIDLTTPSTTMNNINAENKDTQQQQQNEFGIIKQNGTTTIDDNVCFSNWTKELLEIFQKTDNDIHSLMPITNGNTDFSHTSSTESEEISGVKKTGIIILIKENYGFIESIDGEKEYYFHSLSFNDDNCKLGQSVEFDTLFSNGKWKAINVSAKDQIVIYEDVSSEIFTGTVVRTLQMFDSDKEEYTGLIDKNGIEGSNGIMNGWDNAEYEFSMISLKFLKDYINVGDSVRFQVATNPVTRKQRAYNVEVIRDRLKVSND